MMMMVMANIMMSEWTRLGAFVYCHNAWSIRAIVFFNATHIWTICGKQNRTDEGDEDDNCDHDNDDGDQDDEWNDKRPVWRSLVDGTSLVEYSVCFAHIHFYHCNFSFLPMSYDIFCDYTFHELRLWKAMFAAVIHCFSGEIFFGGILIFRRSLPLHCLKMHRNCQKQKVWPRFQNKSCNQDHHQLTIIIANITSHLVMITKPTFFIINSTIFVIISIICIINRTIFVTNSTTERTRITTTAPKLVSWRPRSPPNNSLTIRTLQDLILMRSEVSDVKAQISIIDLKIIKCCSILIFQKNQEWSRSITCESSSWLITLLNNRSHLDHSPLVSRIHQYNRR